jgi:hypothetical protein
MFRVYCLTMRCVVALDHFGALDQRALLLSTAAVIAAAIYCSRSCLQHHLAPRTSFQLAAVLVAAVVLAIASGFAIFMLAWFITVALNAALTATSGSVCAAPPLLGWHREPLELTLHKWRYFTVLPCGDGPGARDVCLLFKERDYNESWVGGLRSADGLSFRGEPWVAITVATPPAGGAGAAGGAVHVTHNYAVLRQDGGWLLAGGQYKRNDAAATGVWLLRARSLWVPAPITSMITSSAAAAAAPKPLPVSSLPQPAVARAARAHWRAVSRALNGTHAGCADARSPRFSDMRHLRVGTCEYDGRLSLVSFRGELLLYARANPAARGQRFVQVSSSADGGRTWSPFRLIELGGYRREEGEVYFFAAQPNPVHAGSLLAVLPLVHNHRGCIGLATSLDGLRWSAVTPVVGCATNWDGLDLYERRGERTVDHVAAGVLRRGGRVQMYVHERVPGIYDAGLRAWALRATGRAAEVAPRLARHSLPAPDFLEWTRASLRSLGAGADGVIANTRPRRTQRGRSDVQPADAHQQRRRQRLARRQRARRRPDSRPEQRRPSGGLPR